MLRVYRLGCLLMLFGLCFFCSCGGGDGEDENSSAVVLSDIHFNPFYDPSLFSALDAADSSEWAKIFKTSTVTAPATWGSDSNYPLLKVALVSIRDNIGDSPVVVFNGDLLGHYFPQTYFKLHGSEDIAAMKAFADKTVAFVMEELRSAVGDVPIMFSVGNSDSYTGIGPDESFLANTAELFYSKFLNGTADRQTFLESFESGGYYSAQIPNKNVIVIGLNTNIFSPLLPGNFDALANAELTWLDSQLAAAKANGNKVWLLMHVPLGADPSATAKLVDSSDKLSSATMMWKATYQTAFQQILSSYPNVVTLLLAGHTHMDEYRIASGEVFHISPGISPVFGNNPGYKIYTFSNTSAEAIDYTAYNYDLGAAPKEFSRSYEFLSEYSLLDPLDAAFEQLFPELVTDNQKQGYYRENYYSGPTPTNAITNTNWPVYWCSVEKMTQQELIDCVNNYNN